MILAPRALFALAALALLSACATRVPLPPPAVPVPVVVPPAPPPVAVLNNAKLAGVTVVASAEVSAVEADRALAAFRTSCPVLTMRSDASGLTVAEDWLPLCAEASAIVPASAAGFFRDRFDWVRVGKGEAFATGYYEPEIAGSRVAAPGYSVSVYAKPTDLVRDIRADGTPGRGRVDHEGLFVPY